MKTVLAALATLALVTLLISQTPSSSGNLYKAWKQEYGMSFDPIEDRFRQSIFEKSVQIMHEHNSRANQTYKMGLNQFSALTDDEFRAYYLGYLEVQDSLFEISSDYQYTQDIDWTQKGYVTGVKDQRQCGSCWAFSATGALQALYRKKQGSLSSFSQQQLVDCSKSYGNHGCNGGLMESAFKYTKDHGITLESSYPYTAKEGSCKAFTSKFKNSGYSSAKGCSDLYNALSGRPVSIAVDANNWSRYSSGVFSNCGTRLDHGVLLVGATDSYWKVKNSWSSGWGEKGYIRLARGNTCGLCNQPSYPN